MYSQFMMHGRKNIKSVQFIVKYSSNTNHVPCSKTV